MIQSSVVLLAGGICLVWARRCGMGSEPGAARLVRVRTNPVISGGGKVAESDAARVVHGTTSWSPANLPDDAWSEFAE